MAAPGGEPAPLKPWWRDRDLALPGVRVELTVGGRRTNTHWGRAGVIVKSDWCGAESYWSTDVAALLDGLDDTIAMHIRQFLDDPNTLV